jgi:hypothetical protein
MSKPNQRMTSGVPEYLGPSVPQDKQIPEQQRALTPSDAAAAILSRAPQVAKRTANDAAFQPSPRHDPRGPMDTSFAASPDFYDTPGERGTMPGACGDMRATDLVGDLVAGMPRGGDAFKTTPVDLGADMATGGEPDGPKSDNRPGAQDYHRTVTDWPAQVGKGDEGMNP